MGYDICDGTQEAISQIAGYEASIGVTAIAPATMTLPAEQLEHILSVAAAYRREPAAEGADLVGMNMEGPFISRVKKGAQDARNIIPCNIGCCQRFLDASDGLVKLIGIAPEENLDFRAFIQQMKDKVTISLAHTNADYDTLTLSADYTGLAENDVIVESEAVGSGKASAKYTPNMVVGAVKEFNVKGLPTIDAAYEAVVLYPSLNFPVLPEWLNGCCLKSNPNILFIKQ